MTPRSSGCVVARGEAPAIDHDSLNAIAIGRAKFAVELDGAAGGDNARVQLWQHAARLDMAFARKKQRVTETALERGFELGERARVEPPMPGGQASKTFEVGTVAAVRHHQRAVERRIRQFPAP